MSWSDLRTAAAIVRREYQLSCRGAVFWTIAALGSLLTMWRASAPGTTAALAAYQTWQTALVGVGVLAILLGGGAAVRDRRQAVLELVLAKPAGSAADLLVSRFIGAWLSLVTLIAIMLGASAVSQMVLGGTSWGPGAYAGALLRSALPIGAATALGFSLASLFTTPLAAGVAAIYWVAAVLTRPYMPMALDLTPSQHWPMPALLTASLVALAAALYARTVRGRQRGGARSGWAAALLFAAAALASLTIISRGDDALAGPDPVLIAVASQTAVEGRRAPGFWLPDASGSLVGLSDFDGRPIVLAFWGPTAPSSVHTLTLLDELAREHHPEDLACIAICIDRDAGTIGLFDRREVKGVVLLWDRGRHFGDSMQWSDSPVAISYDISQVPSVFLLDRERRLVAKLPGEIGPDRLRAAVSRMLAER